MILNQQAARKISIIQKSTLQDTQYQQLLTEYHMINGQFENMLEPLSPAQKNLILDYIGIIAEMNQRLLELACLHAEENNPVDTK